MTGWVKRKKEISTTHRCIATVVIKATEISRLLIAVALKKIPAVVGLQSDRSSRSSHNPQQNKKARFWGKMSSKYTFMFEM